jgi:DNA polymerase-3 subunit delta'
MPEGTGADVMGYDLMPWHAELLLRLLATAIDKKNPHAILLAAPKGTGKIDSAGWLAAAVLCTQGELSGPCGHCDACELYGAGSHGDLRWLEPEEGKRAIGIEPVREAARFLQQTAGYGERKLLVIAPAEAMTISAANALLKTLEEPPGDSVIVLVSDRPDDLPPTVRSRCQIFVMPCPSEEDSVEWLRVRTEFADDDCRRAVKLALGRPKEALALLESGALNEWEALADQCASLLVGCQSPNSVAEALLAWELDPALTLVVRTVDEAVRTSISENPRGILHALESRDTILEWLSAHRRGVNISRDLVVRECCQMLHKALV